MTVMIRKAAPVVPAQAVATHSLEQRYKALLAGRCPDSEQWLAEHLRQVEEMPDDLPDTPDRLDTWSAQHAARVAGDYAAYLEQRRQGSPRRYFANRSQALYFLQQAAPTKSVDGAWLHGTLREWADPRYHGLIRTYLEELGDGDPRCNHVLVYQRLLSRVGCLDPLPLDDQRYLQGCVQLALGRHTDAFLPEVIGYNLGYEQPPLHLLITTYELAELAIDGFYFQLHVTIDNAATGHARRSLQALELLSDGNDSFYQRVRNGYRLNDLGIDTPTMIAGFDLHAELVAALERKRAFGQFMHSDHCRLQGRTINQWMAEPDSMPAFLDALQVQGWVRRGEDPANSRFWKLVDGPTAAMFGVFNAYEKQLLRDWIAADWQGPAPRRLPPGNWEARLALAEDRSVPAANCDIESLIQRMSGNRHALPEGLKATRAYVRATGLTQGDPL